MSEAMLSKTLVEWEPIFEEQSVWYDVSQRTVDAVTDPQLIAAGCFADIPSHPDAESDAPTVQVTGPWGMHSTTYLITFAQCLVPL